MASRVAPPKTEPKKKPPEPKAAPAKAAGRGAVRFDKAFPVWLEGEMGVASGIARNITEQGMFVETREPFALNTRVRVTFTGPSGAELTLEAEVRYQCFINFVRGDAQRAGMRGVGLKFVAPQPEGQRRGRLH